MLVVIMLHLKEGSSWLRFRTFLNPWNGFIYLLFITMGSYSGYEEDFSFHLCMVLQCESQMCYSCENHSAFSLYQFASAQSDPWMMASIPKSRISTIWALHLTLRCAVDCVNCSACPNLMFSFAFLTGLATNPLRQWSFFFHFMFKKPRIFLPLVHFSHGALKQIINWMNPHRNRQCNKKYSEVRFCSEIYFEIYNYFFIFGGREDIVFSQWNILFIIYLFLPLNIMI